MALIDADAQVPQVVDLPSDLAQRALHAIRHIYLESHDDLEGTLGTLVQHPVYELHPIGLKMQGKALVRRYYEHFFGEARRHVVDYVVHGYCYGETSMTVEVTISWRYDDGVIRNFRNLTVLPYGSNGITGERMYAEDEFFRVLFGPILTELEHLHVD
ncbi:hypothetical protein ACFB49_33150 [Sphingomonas sp. DBB INV C78]|uniref:hypothetical protein n=1 Tax=Sphingomonas sp. DBB INV C78 TaxID=3349434 RepID=UPI0036D2275A